ncbi:MAG: amidohydrolase family protein [Planctomycetota bacterium]
MKLQTLFVAAALSAPLIAQDLLPKAAPQAQPIVLEHATLHTIDGGVVLDGTIWFEGGIIRGVLARDEKLKLPEGSAAPLRINLRGKHVFPGMISAHTSLGLIEIGQVPQSVDTDELGDLSPEASALTAINPDSTAIPVARRNGVLAAVVYPTGGLLPGRAAAVQLDGWTNRDMAVRASAGPVVAWPSSRSGRWRRAGGGGGGGGSRDDAKRVTREIAKIDGAFLDARAWLTARTNDPSVPLDVRHDALVPALRGEVPVLILAQSSEQIAAAVQWGQQRKLRIVIVGGHEARSVAALLREHDVPVVIDGVHRLPRRDDAAYDEPFTLARDLERAGVMFCIASGEDYSNDRNLPYHAATAAAYGLDRRTALAAVTLRVAEIFGLADRLGSLAVGKDATLFVADGHPFELSSSVEQAFVQGRTVDLRSKQTELAQKYRERYRQSAADKQRKKSGK